MARANEVSTAPKSSANAGPCAQNRGDGLKCRRLPAPGRHVPGSRWGPGVWLSSLYQKYHLVWAIIFLRRVCPTSPFPLPRTPHPPHPHPQNVICSLSPKTFHPICIVIVGIGYRYTNASWHSAVGGLGCHNKAAGLLQIPLRFHCPSTHSSRGTKGLTELTTDCHLDLSSPADMQKWIKILLRRNTTQKQMGLQIASSKPYYLKK